MKTANKLDLGTRIVPLMLAGMLLLSLTACASAATPQPTATATAQPTATPQPTAAPTLAELAQQTPLLLLDWEGFQKALDGGDATAQGIAATLAAGMAQNPAWKDLRPEELNPVLMLLQGKEALVLLTGPDGVSWLADQHSLNNADNPTPAMTPLVYAVDSDGATTITANTRPVFKNTKDKKGTTFFLLDGTEVFTPDLEFDLEKISGSGIKNAALAPLPYPKDFAAASIALKDNAYIALGAKGEPLARFNKDTSTWEMIISPEIQTWLTFFDDCRRNQLENVAAFKNVCPVTKEDLGNQESDLWKALDLYGKQQLTGKNYTYTDIEWYNAKFSQNEATGIYNKQWETNPESSPMLSIPITLKEANGRISMGKLVVWINPDESMVSLALLERQITRNGKSSEPKEARNLLNPSKIGINATYANTASEKYNSKAYPDFHSLLPSPEDQLAMVQEFANLPFSGTFPKLLHHRVMFIAHGDQYRP